MSDRYDQLVGAARKARDAGRLAEAEQGYSAAAGLAGDDGQQAHALRHVSDIASDRGDFGRALAAGQEALERYRAMSDLPRLDMANAVRVVARALQGIGRTDEAAAAWREAKALYAAAGIAAGVDECDQKLA